MPLAYAHHPGLLRFTIIPRGHIRATVSYWMFRILVGRRAGIKRRRPPRTNKRGVPNGATPGDRQRGEGQADDVDKDRGRSPSSTRTSKINLSPSRCGSLSSTTVRIGPLRGLTDPSLYPATWCPAAREEAARHYFLRLINMASPPRLSISPSRLALMCMITSASFCSHRSPPLFVPSAKPYRACYTSPYPSMVDAPMPPIPAPPMEKG